jgi:two-component system OmpR family sensor kinase
VALATYCALLADMRMRPRHIRPLRDWTLRTRIVASLLGVLIVLCVAIGLFTEVALNHFLVNRLDDQLTAARGRSTQAFQNPPPNAARRNVDDPGRFLLPPGSPTGSVGAHLANGQVTNGERLDSTGQRVKLSDAVMSKLTAVKPDDDPRTLELPGLGAYRVVATTVAPGDVLISGLPMSGVKAILVQMTWVIAALGVIGLIIAAIVGAFIVRLALRPLRRVTATATRVAEMPLDEGEVALAVRVPSPSPNTEVGQVGVALNRMLENVNDALNARHRSETRVRQFVADASHELRTPLASIRGYAELTRRSRDQAPPDIAHAMSRVESEAGRMTTLVEDLLLLARLDAGRPLESGEVDMTRLAVDAVSDAHVSGRDHLWHLNLQDEPVLVYGDEARLRQVLANILANARVHTPAGTNVWISLTEKGQDALLEVRDDGPGIPAQLMPDIFERFSRGQESRSRSAGSTGLGLAIVAAVVAAHRGQIGVTSKPGRTTFSVRLPMHGIRQAPTQSPASFGGQALKV